jgi:nucleotide-binding universal stress UspA family protein
MNVLFPTDFSEPSKNALTYAADLCKKGNYNLHVLSAYSMPYAERTFNSNSLLQAIKENAQENMAQFEAHVKSLDIPYTTEIAMGNPVRVIQEKSKSKQVAYLVMGTTGSSGIEEILLGSNAASVIQGVDKPVLVIPPQAGFKPMKRMVYCSELKALENEETLQNLARFASFYALHVDILHIQGEPGAKEGRAKLDQALASVSHGYSVIKEQDLEKGVLDHARETKADIIASMGKRYGFFERLFHTSLTNKLAFHSEMPLLALHQH